MRLSLPRRWIIIVFAIIFSLPVYSQNCVPTGLNNTVVNSACNQACRDLTFQIPDLRSSTTYQVISTPYNPYPFVTAGGTEDQSLYDDDNYSNVFPLPFTFCFYGQNFTEAVVSSNGLVTFDATMANCGNGNAAWSVTNDIPHPLGGDCAINTYPRSAIMGAFMDLDPRPGPNSNVQSSPPDRKIEWRVEGSAPCRRFVVSFYKIGVFQNTICGQTTPATFQIVMYESTGVIDVFIENKSCVAQGTNGNRAILGVQNWDKTQAVAAPFKNAVPWTASLEGYRFVPSGGTSRFVSSELLAMDLTPISTATSVSSTPGLRDITFPNVCTPNTSTQYIIRTTFAACDNPGTLLVGLDTITVNRATGLTATATSTNTGCGIASGSVTVNVPVGAGTPPYTFILDGTVTQVGPGPMIFNNVSQGPHSILVTDNTGGCSGTVNVTVNQTNNLQATVTPAATACPGVDNGAITVNPTTGTGPFNFVLSPGNVLQSGNTTTFTGLAPGNYSITVTDATGCTSAAPFTATVASGNGLIVQSTTTATSCVGASNGAISLIPGNGTAPFVFVLDGGPVTQNGASANFTGLTAGNHTITITDANGCTAIPALTISVAAGPGLSTTATHTDVLCNSSATGSITVTQPAIGTPPFEYSIDGGANWQTGNAFNGLTAATYTVLFRDAGGCQGQLTEVVSQPAVLATIASGTAVVCNGQSNGIITLNTTGGATPYEYSIDNGTTWQSSNIFNVAAGQYNVLIRDANLCSVTRTVDITDPAILTATAATTNASCNGGDDGTITITANGGNGNFRYSLDGVNFQSSNIFNVAPGSYNVVVRDNLGCTFNINGSIVSLTNDLNFVMPANPTICEGTSVQLNINSNATQYLWSPSTGISNPNISNPVGNPTITTAYVVTITFGRCTADLPITINVNDAPVPDAGANGFICYGQDFQLRGSGGTTFNWTPTVFLNDPKLQNPIASPDRTTTYSLSVADANGCISLTTDEVTVDVTPPIKVTTSPFDTVVYSGEQFQVLATSVATDYSWSPAIGLNNPNIANPLVTAGQVGDVVQYTVTASTQAGCKGEGFVRVRVYEGPDLYVPTGFTPNNDGLNDTFFPFPVGIRDIKYFRVFNRWGQLIFSTTTMNHGWDGKWGAVEQGSGVYTWMAEGITRDNKIITKKGTVALIR